MRAVVQRVAEAKVLVAGKVVGEIGPGLCVLLGIARDDEASDAERLAGQIARLRIFENADGKFDRSLVDTGGSALVVSQFTLIADSACYPTTASEWRQDAKRRRKVLEQGRAGAG